MELSAGGPAVAKIVLLDGGPNRETTLERAHREVELLSAVDSDRVVKVLTDVVEIGDPVDAVCWAEEYLDGVDVRAALKTPWDEVAVWTLMSDIGEALAACHELEVVHRDLSAANVRLTPDDRYVLMDPGLARHLAKTALTGAYQPGTPGWRSPEHVPGGDPIPASDIFSLGIIAYVALTGRFPIDPSQDSAAYDLALVNNQAPSVGTARQDISPELVTVVDRCLARQSARRYLDGAELCTEMNRLRDA